MQHVTYHRHAVKIARGYFPDAALWNAPIIREDRITGFGLRGDEVVLALHGASCVVFVMPCRAVGVKGKCSGDAPDPKTLVHLCRYKLHVVSVGALVKSI